MAAWSPTTSSAATTHRGRRSAATASACSRTCARCAAPRRAFCDHHGSGASLTGFLDHAAGLHAEEIRPGEDRRITVSTIHRAKGTEARVVLLLACEEQLLPSWRALESPDDEDLAEERRLFYVAATRAKDTLVITRAHVRAGRATGGPSRFLFEAGLLAAPANLAA
jgi:ATP-dependent DNA helicase UvrD/PcrA